MDDPNQRTAEAPLTQRVLGAIEAQHLTPKPKWHFLFREWVVRVVALTAFIVGSIATALSIYIVTATQFVERRIEQSDIDLLFDSMPYLWLVLVCAGVIYTSYAIRHLKHGYRYHSAWLVSGAIVLSVAGGTALHAWGAGEAIDRYLIASVPGYGSATGFRPEHWMQLPQGIVAGTVTFVDDRSAHCAMTDIEGRAWTVRIASSTVRGNIIVREGVMVKVIGTTTNEGTFEAVEVRPFRGRGAHMMEHAVREDGSGYGRTMMKENYGEQRIQE